MMMAKMIMVMMALMVMMIMTLIMMIFVTSSNDRVKKEDILTPAAAAPKPITMLTKRR